MGSVPPSLCKTLVFIGLLQQPALAQEPGPLQPGQRVRVSPGCWPRALANSVQPIDCRTQTGILVSLTSDSITLIDTEMGQVGSVLVRSLESLDRLEVRVARRRHTGLGALFGFGAGAGLGALVAYTQFTEGETPGREALIPVAGAALAIVGAGIGWAVKTDQWAQVPRMRIPISLRPRRGRVEVEAAVAF